MIYKDRHRFSKTSRALGKLFSFMSADMWTFFGLALTVLSAYYISKYEFILAAVLLFLGVACDFIDGSVARYRKEATNFGAYFDTVMDRYGEAVVALSLLFISLPGLYIPSYVWIGLYLFGSMMTTYVKASAKEKLDINVIGGLLERPERMILLVIGIGLASSGMIYLTYTLILLAVMTNVSALQRLYVAFTSAKKRLL